MGPNGITLRRVAARDLDGIRAIAGEVLEGPWSRRALEEEIARPLAIVLVAERGGRVIGFAIAWLVSDEGNLLLLAVARTEQRHGTGRLLMAAIEDDARAKGASVMHLEVRVDNRSARAFYRALGYAETGVRTGYYNAPPGDAVLMSRSLRLPSGGTAP